MVHKKVAVVLLVSLTVLVLGFLLLNLTGVVTVGRAWSSGQAPPAGYYWEEEPSLLSLPCSTGLVPIKLVGSQETSTINTCCNVADGVCGDYKDLKSGYSACYKQNSYIPKLDLEPTIADYPLLCDMHQGELKWISCNQNQLLSENGKFVCQSNQWIACDTDLEGYVHVNNDNLLCNGQKWLICTFSNKDPFCKILGLPEWNFNIQETKAFSTIAGRFEKKGNTVNVNDVVDVAENKIFYNTLTPQKTVFFKYKGIFYKITFDDEFKLSVSTIAGTEVASTTLQSDGQPHFNPVQLDLDFDGDGRDDAYVNMIVGTLYGNKELLIVVSPRLDFDNTVFSTAVTLLSSGNTQEFSFAGDYTFNLFEDQGNYVLIIQNKEYVATESSQATHYLDELNTKKVSYTSLKAFDKFVILDLTTVKEYTSLFLSPQKEVTLTTEYEAEFNNEIILDIQDEVNSVPFGLVGICENDPPVLHTLTVCDKDKEIFDLTHGNMTIKGDLLFLYYSPQPGQTKTGHVYKIIDLEQEQEQLAVIFANNLVQGKSVAVKAHDEYYLLTYEKTAYLDLTRLKLKRLGKDKEAEFFADGDQEDIVFNLPLGKQINIQLFAEPNLRYVLSSVTIEKDNINLIDELEARFSTYGKITITTPNIGQLSLNDAEDIKLLKNTMKINYGSQEVELIMGQPHVDEIDGTGALFLYDQFSVDGKSGIANTYAKYASVYLYADLTGNSFEHGFDSENFILPLVKGNSIAFSLEGKYYLLSYAEPWTGQSGEGFEIEKMQLVSLDDQAVFPLKAAGAGLEFNFGINKIEVTIDTDSKIITFTGRTAAEVGRVVTEFTSEEDFSAVLIPGTEDAEVALNVNGVEYQICDQGDIKELKSRVYVCHETEEEQLALNEGKIAGNVQYTYLGIVNGKKTIQFQHRFAVNETGLTLPWTGTANNLAEGKKPLLVKGPDILELSGGNELQLFKLSDKVVSNPITMQSQQEAFENGTIVVGSEQVFFQKALVDTTIFLGINLLEHPILTEEGIDVNTQGQFVTEVGGEVFTIAVSKLGSNLFVSITNSDNQFEYIGLLPEGAMKTVLLSDGSVVKVEVLDVEAQSALLST